MSEVIAGSIDLGFRPRARDDIRFVVVDGQAVVHGPEPGRLAVLNPTATLVWQCCDGSGTVGEIAADAASAFDAPPDAVARDVLAVVRGFGAQGLLVGVRGDAGAAVVVAAPDGAGTAAGSGEPRVLVDPPSP